MQTAWWQKNHCVESGNRSERENKGEGQALTYESDSRHVLTATNFESTSVMSVTTSAIRSAFGNDMLRCSAVQRVRRRDELFLNRNAELPALRAVQKVQIIASHRRIRASLGKTRGRLLEEALRMHQLAVAHSLSRGKGTTEASRVPRRDIDPTAQEEMCAAREPPPESGFPLLPFLETTVLPRLCWWLSDESVQTLRWVYLFRLVYRVYRLPDVTVRPWLVVVSCRIGDTPRCFAPDRSVRRVPICPDGSVLLVRGRVHPDGSGTTSHGVTPDVSASKSSQSDVWYTLTCWPNASIAVDCVCHEEGFHESRKRPLLVALVVAWAASSAHQSCLANCMVPTGTNFLCSWCLFVCVLVSRFRGQSAVGVVLAWLSTGVSGRLAMVSKFWTRGSWIPVKERAEKVLTSVISIDVRKQSMCKFCTESNVWTRWRCRRW